MSKIDREILNHLIVSRLKGLHQMYKTAEEEARLEKEEQCNKDWQEWLSLDEESKQYVLNYLNNNN